MGFLYYLPGHKGQAGPDVLQKFNLLHIMDPGDKLHCCGVHRGIDGQPGVIVGHALCWDVNEVKFSANIQWQPFPVSEHQAHCGILPAKPPTPESLQRTKMIPGEYLKDDEGRAWMIPIARKMTDDGAVCMLPTVLDLDEQTGELRRTKVKKRYEKIWNHAVAYVQAMYDALMAAEDKGADAEVVFTIPDAERMTADAIAANYRVSVRELTMIEALTDDMAPLVADILTDQNGWERLKKSPDQGSGDT